MQTELERYKFLVRSYLRARIAKIDAHTLQSADPDADQTQTQLNSQGLGSSGQHQQYQPRLSAHELAYATRRQALLHQHFLGSFLAAFPDRLQHLNDRAGSVGMVDGPDVDAAVFVRLLREDATFRIVRGVEEDLRDLGGKVGDIFIVRWRDARDLVRRGGAELV